MRELNPANQNLLHYANLGDEIGVSASLAAGADVNYQDPLGQTALLMAAAHNHVDVARLLLSKGADINLSTTEGWGPWIAAAMFGHSEMVQLLLSCGTEIHVSMDQANDEEMEESIFDDIPLFQFIQQSQKIMFLQAALQLQDAPSSEIDTAYALHRNLLFRVCNEQQKELIFEVINELPWEAAAKMG